MSVEAPANFLTTNANIGFTPTVSSLSIFGGIIVLLVLCVGAVLAFQYYKLYESPWWSDRAKTANFDFVTDWLDSFRSSPSLNPLGGLNEVPSGLQLSAPPPVQAPPQANLPTPPVAAWCFVGEDLTGRYCVKVPSSASCDRTRVFLTQQDCELQSGNAMPAGVVSPHDGRKMTPLSSGILAP
jgi:hypothetical protein